MNETEQSAFVNGAEAARRGKSIENNPYAKIATREAWRAGFLSVKPNAR